ncbi:MAG: DUF547 domain-containing protein [Saprospiraceae bacterium]
MKNPILTIFFVLASISTFFAQQIDQSFFQETEVLLQANVKNGRIKYANLQNNAALEKLIKQVENADLSGTDQATQKAFRINAYNLHVINSAAALYPIASVQSEPGFFDRKKVIVAGKKYTLNEFEKKELLAVYDDPRLHFVLVCGAVGCPPIIDRAYKPETLEAQLEEQTRLSLNDPSFIKVEDNKVELSKIFEWYRTDFGNNKKAIIKYINEFRDEAIPTNSKLSYYSYDWSLNEYKKPSLAPRDGVAVGNNESRYVVSSTIPKGTFEVKIFNNLYTQRTGSKEELTNRSTFFTTFTNVLYGLTNRINAGVLVRYRRVRNDGLPSDATSVFKSVDNINSRQGITGIGPQIRIAPVPQWENFSIQSSFTFPVGNDLNGSEGTDGPYIDWDGPVWNTQIFNDFSIGSYFSLFTEVDLLIEEIGFNDEAANLIRTPVTVIFSYLPDPKVTLYALGGYAPSIQAQYDYFIQGGFGAKYQFTPNLELELLYTGFRNKEQIDTGGRAATYNLGLRFNL